MSLVLIQLLRSHKVFERPVVYPDVYDYIRPREVHALLLKALDNYKQLLIINRVIQLYRGYSLREVPYRLLYLIVFLGYHAGNHSVRRISLDLYQEHGVIVYKQGSYSQKLL